MTAQTIRAASRGDTDLVVLRLRVPQRRFAADLAAAVVKMTLIPASGVVGTWFAPTTDVMLNAKTREVSLRVGPLGSVNPPAGTYTPDIQVNVNNLQVSVDSEHPDTVVIE